MQERTLIAIADGKKAKGLYVAPSLADNIKQIFFFFPFSPEVPSLGFESNMLSNP